MLIVPLTTMLDMEVVGNRLFLTILEVSGNIWLMENLNR
jgi:hypothetical protein